MAEDFNPQETGRRIAAEYLSKRRWAQEWREAINRQVYPGFQREELEEKERECDRIADEAEDNFSQSVERWRQERSPAAKQVLRRIVDMVGTHTDLGFFAQRIVARLKQELGPF